jgi:NAD(P)H-hydrate epimerase
MAALDARTVATGIPALSLMERAGKAITETILSVNPTNIKRDSYCVLCGPGNNGGDGFVIARHLLKKGLQTHVFFPAYDKLSEECQKQVALYLEAGGTIVSSDVLENLRKALKNSRVVIDALLGIGQRSAPRGLVGELLGVVSSTPAPRGGRFSVAVDLPTGVNSDTGEVYAGAFRADMTVTVELAKRGMVQYPAREYCGNICAISIGLDCGGSTEYSVYDGSLRKPLSQRRPNTHKGMYGNVLVVGGSSDMPGAPILSSISALRSGAGIVRQAVLANSTETNPWPEILLARVSSRDFFQEASLQELETPLSNASCVVVGPGIGLRRETRSFVTVLCDYCAHNNLPVVIDADALTLIEGRVNEEKVLFPSAIITPHPGEMSRLLRIPTAEVERDRYSAASSALERTGAIVVLKGSATVIRTHEEGFVNLTGNPFMATAGSGDVLSGLIAGLVAQGVAPAVAAPLSVWIHGKAGDLAHAQTRGPIIASDIAAHIPAAMAVCV